MNKNGVEQQNNKSEVVNWNVFGNKFKVKPSFLVYLILKKSKVL